MTWVALYTSPNAKRTPPGLWAGSPLVVAEAVHRPLGDVLDDLEELAEHRLIERDDAHRVITLTQLPDRCERPSNGDCLRKWWNLFRGVSPCPIRDRWINLLAWLCFPLNEAREKLWEVWSTTFGTLMPNPVVVEPDRGLSVQKQCSLPFPASDSGVPTTNIDTHPPSIRMRMRDLDQGSGIRVSDQGAGDREREHARWSPPPPVLTQADLLRVGLLADTPEGLCRREDMPPSTDIYPGHSRAPVGIMRETQEHDAWGNPWGPEGAPRDRFINGRRRNF
jgi:hypothetical protein